MNNKCPVAQNWAGAMPLTARSYQTKKQDTSGSQAKWNDGYLPVDMSWRNGYFCFACRNSIAKVQCVELFVPLRCYLYRTMVCPSSLERALHFPRWVWNTLEKIGCLNVLQNKSGGEEARSRGLDTYFASILSSCWCPLLWRQLCSFSGPFTILYQNRAGKSYEQ